MKRNFFKTLAALISAMMIMSALGGCADSEKDASSMSSGSSAASETDSSSEKENSVPSESSEWTIKDTYWEIPDEDVIVILNADGSAVWSNPMGGEKQKGHYEWNVDKGRLYIEDWDVAMEMTGRGLRIYNESRDHTMDQLERLPDGYRTDAAPYDSIKKLRDNLTETYWTTEHAYYGFLADAKVKNGSIMRGEFVISNYSIDAEGNGTIKADQGDIPFKFTDGNVQFKTDRGWRAAERITKEQFDSVFK